LFISLQPKLASSKVVNATGLIARLAKEETVIEFTAALPFEGITRAGGGTAITMTCSCSVDKVGIGEVTAADIRVGKKKEKLVNAMY
jgi:hypothetical protein